MELDTESNPHKVYLFMEACVGPLQASQLPPLTTSARMGFIKDIFRQLLEALSYLQTQRVAHHDVKGENILINAQGQLKLCDFGVAERYDAVDECRIFYGSPAYQSPELARNVDGGPFDGAKADIWSAGVVLYQLVFDRLPFVGDSVYLVIRSVDKDPLRIPPCSDQCLVSLLQQLLNKDPKTRPYAHEALQHPWFGPDKETLLSSVPCCSIQ